jgi:hypothetical protein
MSESLTTLRSQLSHLRDASLGLFDGAEKVHGEIRDAEKRRYHHVPAVWGVLPPELQGFADELRGELRPLMVKISAALRGSPLMGEADFRDLAREAKVMAAANRYGKARELRALLRVCAYPLALTPHFQGHTSCCFPKIRR